MSYLEVFNRAFQTLTTALAATAILPKSSNAIPPPPPSAAASACWVPMPLLIFASFFPSPPLDTSSTVTRARSSCDSRLGIAAWIVASGIGAPPVRLSDGPDIVSGRCFVWSEDDTVVAVVGRSEAVLPVSGPTETSRLQPCHKSQRASTSAMTSFSHRLFPRTVSEKARAESTVEHLSKDQLRHQDETPSHRVI